MRIERGEEEEDKRRIKLQIGDIKLRGSVTRVE